MLISPDRELDAESRRVNQTLYGGLADSLPIGCFAEPSSYTAEDPTPEATEGEPQSKKRKVCTTEDIDDNDIKDEELEVEANLGLEVAEESARIQRKQRFLGIRLPEMLYPKSAYEEYECTTSIVHEKIVLQQLLV